jgi:hypothetical protein
VGVLRPWLSQLANTNDRSVGRNSLVGIATRYSLDGSECETRRDADVLPSPYSSGRVPKLPPSPVYNRYFHSPFAYSCHVNGRPLPLMTIMEIKITLVVTHLLENVHNRDLVEE